MKGISPAQAGLTPQPGWKRRWLRVVVIGLAAGVLMVGGLVAVPVISPSAGAAMADWLRGIIGPEAVAEIESVSFRIQDIFNQARYQVSGGQAQISWADPTDTTSAASPAKPDTSRTIKASLPAKPLDIPANDTKPIDRSSVDVVTAPSGVDNWQAFGPTVGNTPIMARASVKPDPSRPYAQAMLVRIDLSQVQLHLGACTVEPVAAKGTPSFPRPGDVPQSDQANLLAAFNGGFKAIHGGYGMMTDGVTILPPLDNMATIAMYNNDGHVRIGAWGRDITSTPDLVAYRQNCPLLIDEGQINPHVNDESRKEWGYTVKNLDTTWRSGVGISQDGRFLIYAVGNSVTVESLAQALRQAGAYFAMQLDINGFYTRFVTYAPTNTAKSGYPVVASKLLNQMSGDPAQFLHPYDRDFFYITARTKA